MWTYVNAEHARCTFPRTWSSIMPPCACDDSLLIKRNSQTACIRSISLSLFPGLVGFNFPSAYRSEHEGEKHSLIFIFGDIYIHIYIYIALTTVWNDKYMWAAHLHSTKWTYKSKRKSSPKKKETLIHWLSWKNYRLVLKCKNRIWNRKWLLQSMRSLPGYGHPHGQHPRPTTAVEQVKNQSHVGGSRKFYTGKIT